MRGRVFIAGVCSCAVFAASAMAGGEGGDIVFRDCLSGNTATAPDACTQLPGAAASGLSSGLNNVTAVDISADGTSLYAVTSGDDSIVRFKRNTRSGALTFKGCISGNSATGEMGTDACAQLPDAGGNGAASGLDGPTDVAVSRDGKSVYTSAANDDAISLFERFRSGRLQFTGCITGRELPDAPCTAIPGATGIGSNVGMDSPQGIVVSRDGKSVYTSTQQDDGVTRFKRAGDGSLTYKGCYSADLDTGPTGTDLCNLLETTSAGGADTGLNALGEIAISRDGESLYGISGPDSSVAHFERAESGALTYEGCLTAATESGPSGSDACEETATTAGEGADTGMADLTSIAISPDGDGVYVAAQTDAAVTAFTRKGSGALEYVGCLSGEQPSDEACGLIPSAVVTSGGNNSGLAAPSGLAFAGNAHLYVSLQSDHGVAHLERDPPSNDFGFRGCITGEVESGPTGTEACDAIDSADTAGAGSGLDSALDLVASPNRKSLYSVHADDDSIARFKLTR